VTTATLACPLCGGRLEPGRGARERWRLLDCADCGHVVAPVAVSSAAADDAEALQQAHFGDAFVAGDDRWTRLIDRANARRVRRVLGRVVAPRGRVLEVGPGHGAVLVALVEAGFAVEGLELSPAVAEMTRRRSGVTVAVGTLEARAAEAPGRYDAVVARHVLEHMADPAAAVGALRRLLRPGGVAYVAVPNIGAPESTLPGWSGYQPYHLHYFTPARLRALCERGGFAVTRLHTREPFSGWVNAVVGSLRGGGTAGGPAPRPAGAVVSVYNVVRLAIGAVLAPLRLAQACSGYGEEIEMLARKPAAP
jgi:SAM-dependent methyltransferase